ncbi:hypothetical protein [Halopelagius longus]|uniref:Uncharacterized protein n=1 Tax=Halopelagius longus TaxID=1236180 RepID=A0A1H1B023_9EURY|nr:hypothetical protein [Halopelagius longus]RDI70586.1 hypothetical protein DWB78_01960 [Halopelagius longus]SDQ45267.1 hypothetical protein SAMN05216278_1571 [Halopelagius longus]
MRPSDVPPPTVPSPEGWRVVSEEATTPFDALVVSVRARTVLLADERLRERANATVDAATESPADEDGDAETGGDGDDATWRFFFASRLRLDPAAPSSRAVTRLVTNRANAGFSDVLSERGFDAVRAVESRPFRIRGEEADLTRYRARVSLREFALVAEGYLAVWPDDGGFLVAGGAYPRAVESGPAADELSALLEPERFREELFEMVRATA